MFISKIEVLVGHQGRFDGERLQGLIEQALLDELRDTIYEVRDGGTHEVTLASIMYSLEERAPFDHATHKEEREPVRT